MDVDIVSTLKDERGASFSLMSSHNHTLEEFMCCDLSHNVPKRGTLKML